MKHNLKFLGWSKKNKKLEILYYNDQKHSVKYFNLKKARANLIPFNFHPIFEVQIVKSFRDFKQIRFHKKNKLALKILNTVNL